MNNQYIGHHHGNSPVHSNACDAKTSSLDIEAETYVLELNRTRLLFIPPLALDGDDPNSITPGTVVQVCLRGDHKDGIFNVFSVEQASITRTIETLVAGHVNASHKLPRCVVIKDLSPGYSLTGVRKPWRYGRGKKFRHGDVVLRVAEDKWIFHFEKV